MAGGNLSPRQKMIGMMYLVLTALLALNVSKQILDAFVIVNTGIESTTKILDGKNQQTYSQFDFQKKQNEAKVKRFYDKAQLVKRYSAELVKKIQDIKTQIMAKEAGLPGGSSKDT